MVICFQFCEGIYGFAAAVSARRIAFNFFKSLHCHLQFGFCIYTGLVGVHIRLVKVSVVGLPEQIVFS